MPHSYEALFIILSFDILKINILTQHQNFELKDQQ